MKIKKYVQFNETQWEFLKKVLPECFNLETGRARKGHKLPNAIIDKLTEKKVL